MSHSVGVYVDHEDDAAGDVGDHDDDVADGDVADGAADSLADW